MLRNVQNWEVRVSFPVYVIALSSVVGWVLFMVFAGVGVVALPVDYIRGFFGRPRAIITKTEYLKRASDIAVRARKVRIWSCALNGNAYMCISVRRCVMTRRNADANVFLSPPLSLCLSFSFSLKHIPVTAYAYMYICAPTAQGAR